MNSRLAFLVELTRSAIETSIREYVPDCAHKNFALWALSEDNQNQEAWLNAMGIPQLAKLTLTLFSDLNDDDLDRLITYTAPLNTYLTFEVVSDNLAIGLAQRTTGDATFDLRCELLTRFNDAMIAKLNGTSSSAADMLAELKAPSQSISGFSQSLNPSKHLKMAQAYLDLHPDVTLDDLEYAAWPSLVTNIETAVDLAKSMEGYLTRRLVTFGLVSRYRAVNELLANDQIPLAKRAHLGADAILVMPTLAYYVGILGEAIRPNQHYAEVVENGSLHQALYYAALLVRLTNDLGTSLVTQTAFERADLMSKLASYHRNSALPNESLPQLLLSVGDAFGPILTRLQKDIQHGEFNICLSDVSEELSFDAALQVFSDKLTYFTQLYGQTRNRLCEQIQAMNEILGDPVILAPILKFVQFHEAIYSYHYSEAAGEYAI